MSLIFEAQLKNQQHLAFVSKTLERVMNTSGASPNVFLRKMFSFFQMITYLESKFEEAGRTAISAKKSCNNLLEIIPKSLSGGGFGWLGSVLEGSWGVLGRLGPS